ncbi:hypothetical protein ACOJBO_02635 [Rhizobium beringeri]
MLMGLRRWANRLPRRQLAALTAEIAIRRGYAVLSSERAQAAFGRRRDPDRPYGGRERNSRHRRAFSGGLHAVERGRDAFRTVADTAKWTNEAFHEQ